MSRKDLEKMKKRILETLKSRGELNLLQFRFENMDISVDDYMKAVKYLTKTGKVIAYQPPIPLGNESERLELAKMMVSGYIKGGKKLEKEEYRFNVHLLASLILIKYRLDYTYTKDLEDYARKLMKEEKMIPIDCDNEICRMLQ